MPIKISRKRKTLRQIYEDLIEVIKRLSAENKSIPSNLRVRLYRLREALRDEIDDLTYFAENLPPNQLRQVFTSEALEPMIKTIVSRNEREDDPEPGLVSNTRLFLIGYMLIQHSLGITGALLNDRYHNMLYREYEGRFRQFLDAFTYSVKKSRRID